MAVILISKGYKKQGSFLIALLAIFYIIISGIYAMKGGNDNSLDFFQAYKCFWYIFVLAAVSFRHYFYARDISKLNTFLLILFAIIYSIKRFILLDDRPTVLVENNFELIFVALIFYANFVAGGKRTIRDVALLIFIIALSGSRSAAVVALIVILFSIQFRRMRFKDIIVALSVIIGSAIALNIFESRSSGGLESIDRYKFFEQFLYATRNWGVGEFLFGAPRITPLPPEVCNTLSFYHTLFSRSDDGSCYSVILHSFDLRAVYDHGLIGLSFMLWSVWYLLGGLPKNVKLCVTLVLFLTGMSVSSLNNVYVALSLFIFMSISKKCINSENLNDKGEIVENQPAVR